MLMAHMSKRFNFDDFDAQIAEALEERAEQQEQTTRIKRPGEIGAVAIQLSFYDDDLSPIA